VSDLEGDNCPSIANPDQANLDEDSLGDVCDADSDGDRIPETFDAESAPCANGNIEGCDDNCPLVRNTDQADANGDGIGDLCANDADGDYVEDALDLCPDEVGSRFMDGCPEPGVNGACSVGAGSERWGGAMWFVLTGLLTGLGRRRRRG
ncbi:MAG: MYXO-CTERM domain-containing protein, partial [Bradymonadia bacterium]